MPKTAISGWSASPSSCRAPRARWWRAPPEFGEQTEEVLAEFGFSADEIAELRQAKVV